MAKKNVYKIVVTGLLISEILIFGLPVFAYEIQDLPNTPVKGDFVLGPGKMELFVDPGDEVKREILITNRMGETRNFKVEIEDFRGSRDISQAIVLLGQEKGPYSLKDYIKPEISEFSLMHGQRMVLPIKISIPQDAEPGGLYGSVIISSIPPKSELKSEGKKATGQVSIVPRLASLIYVRVSGDVQENGLLKDFGVKEGKKILNAIFFEKTPITFTILFENNGSVHLAPYGIIEIKNIAGKKIDEIPIDPWFVMPDSLRLKEVSWGKKNILFGRYTATVGISRGYEKENIIDEKSITFWIIPWKFLLIAIVILILLSLFLRWVFTTFEIRRKE